MSEQTINNPAENGTGEQDMLHSAKTIDTATKPEAGHDAPTTEASAVAADTSGTTKADSGAKADNNKASSNDDTAHEVTELEKVIKEQANEGDNKFSTTITLKKILGGDILNTANMRRQIGLFVVIAIFMLFYIANRYACQKDLIEIDKLNKELKDAKYKALSSGSVITERSRESNVLEVLKSNNDSTLKIPSQPPYIINVPEE